MQSGKYIRTPEMRQAQSIRSKNQVFSQESRNKMSLAGKGRKFTQEHKDRIGAANKGKTKPPVSIETRLKQSIARKGKKPSTQAIENMKRAQSNRPPEYGIKVSERQRGENNPYWKGGITPLHKQIRTSKEYKEWRKAVFERDDYTCQECGARGVEIHADHIKAFALYPDLRLELSNGRTLCVPCHKKTENYNGKGITKKIKELLK